jgi:dipeptidyl-peptidase-4
VNSTQLTLERLFESPALGGPVLLKVEITLDGRRVTFLRSRDEDKDCFDLWEYDVAAGRSRLLVDAAAAAPAENLSDEEKNRRERQRTAAFSGITEYAPSPLRRAFLIPVAGRLYYADLESITDGKPGEAPNSGGPGAVPRVTEISPDGGAATDAKLSPRGDLVAFVRNQNLHLCDLGTRSTRALTTDGGGPIKNGMAEFIAQEEMSRHTGYWWAPDGCHIAFARIDENPVSLKQRFEISADDITTYTQRYPAAGESNVRIRLGVVEVAGGNTVWMDLGNETDIYLARVSWLPNGRTVAVQRQSRDQKRLDLMLIDIGTGRGRVILTETSDTWVELHDELSFLSLSDEFIWASSRDGHRHLYLYGLDGGLVRRLTHGNWSVDDLRSRAIKRIDESRRCIYFTAGEKHPTERHLYRISLDAPDAAGADGPCALTRISPDDGLHSINMAPHGDFYVDQFTSEVQPPRLDLRALDGRLLAHIVDNRIAGRHPYAGHLAEDSTPQFGSLNAADGQALYFRLFKPPGFDPSRRYPVIVDVYGGPGVQRVLRGWCGASFTQILTRAGYLVFQLDNRGSAHRGTAFESPIHGRLGEAEVADQVAGVDWLRSRPYVDAERIGVWGWSYGGYLSLMLMCTAPDAFRAGVAGAPVTDWALYDTHYTERYLGRPADNPEGYALSSVLPHALGLEGRLLLMHGMADDNVLLAHSTKLCRTLQDLGKPFDVMMYPAAKHGLLRQRDGRHAYAMILRFFGDALRQV